MGEVRTRVFRLATTQTALGNLPVTNGSGGGQLAFEALEVAGDPELGGYVARAAR